MKTENNIADRLSKRLKESRKNKGLSLEATAKLSGVSRSMLSQIERGESSPTVATLWNLTRALQVDFAGLLDEEKPDKAIKEILRDEHTPTITSLGKGCRIRILSPAHQVGQLEIYEISFSANGELASEPHSSGCEEHLTVQDGAISVMVDDDIVHLNQGDTVRYSGDRPHTIRVETEHAKVLLIVYNS
ncbi:MAG: helix-turn-helix transcriptional regulator [Rhizobiales bacterium]|nr:XRE family transcriptional regulator [Hyphomicrobiales bacterium]NRB13148.1 helix-turn-helix transcriptional regulator [Hyphomicrobiales bacterium]